MERAAAASGRAFARARRTLASCLACAWVGTLWLRAQIVALWYSSGTCRVLLLAGL